MRVLLKTNSYGKWGLIDIKTNQTIIPFEYEDMGNTFIGKIYNSEGEILEMNNIIGFIAAKKEGSFIDEKNNPHIKFIFDDVDDECIFVIIPKMVNGRKIKNYISFESKCIPAVLYQGEWYQMEYDEEKKNFVLGNKADKVSKRKDYKDILNMFSNKKEDK